MIKFFKIITFKKRLPYVYRPKKQLEPTDGLISGR